MCLVAPKLLLKQNEKLDKVDEKASTINPPIHIIQNVLNVCFCSNIFRVRFKNFLLNTFTRFSIEFGVLGYNTYLTNLCCVFYLFAKFRMQTVLSIGHRERTGKYIQQYCLLLLRQKFLHAAFSNVKRFKLPQCGLLSAVKSMRQNNNIRIYNLHTVYGLCWVSLDRI